MLEARCCRSDAAPCCCRLLSVAAACCALNASLLPNPVLGLSSMACMRSGEGACFQRKPRDVSCQLPAIAGLFCAGAGQDRAGKLCPQQGESLRFRRGTLFACLQAVRPRILSWVLGSLGQVMPPARSLVPVRWRKPIAPASERWLEAGRFLPGGRRRPATLSLFKDREGDAG